MAYEYEPIAADEYEPVRAGRFLSHCLLGLSHRLEEDILLSVCS